MPDESDQPDAGPEPPSGRDDTDPSPNGHAGVAPPAEAEDQQRPRRRGLVISLVVAAVVIWLVIAGILLISGASSASRGIDAMARVREISTGSLVSFVDSVSVPDSPQSNQVDLDLADATDAFRSAHSATTSPIVAPLRVLPVIGRQIRSVAAMSDAAATTTSSARTSFAEMSEIAATTPQTAAERLEAGRRTKAALDQFSNDVDGLDLGPDEGLFGRLADARQRFVNEQDQLRDTLGRAQAAVTGVDVFMTGPTRYLVLAANNAEMRAGSGMFLQAGELTVEEGRFTLSPLEPTAEMVLDSPGATVDPDVAALWDWLSPATEWRNLNPTPRFEESARMASEMWEASGHPPVDGVIALDVVGLKRLLELTGPVEVTDPDGTVSTVSAKSVVKDLLLQQYISFDSEKDERRDRLSGVGQAVFSALNDRAYTPGRLLRALQSSGRGRHLMMWSSDPVQQAGWEALGTSGIVLQDDMLLSVMNTGGNKLDQFLKVRSDMTWTPQDGRTHVSVEVQITNDTPARGLPRYVQGPYPGLDAQPGQYLGMVQLTIPRTATSPTTSGAELFRSGEDGPSRSLVTKVSLLRGDSTTITFEFDVPDALPAIQVLASGRVPATKWFAGPVGDTSPETWLDNTPHTVRLDAEGD